MSENNLTLQRTSKEQWHVGSNVDLDRTLLNIAQYSLGCPDQCDQITISELWEDCHKIMLYLQNLC